MSPTPAFVFTLKDLQPLLLISRWLFGQSSSCQKCCCPGKDRPITLWALGISGPYCQDFWGVNGPAPQRSVLLRLGTATFLSLFCHVTNTTTERTSQGDCWEGLGRLRRA